MTNKARFIGLGIGVLLIAAALGVVLLQGPGLTTAGTALAQSAPTATPKAPAQQGGQNPSAPAKSNLSTYVDAFWAALAKRLGISVDTAKSQVTASEKDVIEQMVKDGKLTRAQADRIEQNLNNNGGAGGLFLRGFPGRGVPGGRFGQTGPGQNGGKWFGFWGSTAELEAVARVLKLDPSALTSQLKSGKTLADIATAQNVDQAAVKQAIIDTAKAEIQRQVQDGVLTQAQANTMSANLTLDKIDLTRMPFRGGFFRGNH